MLDVVELATALIDTPSVTGDEGCIARWLEQFCQGAGWSVERQVVASSRWNLFVNWDSHADVVFCTHLDTVPPYFPARREAERLYGRGACDTKGIMAAMLVAGLRLHEGGKIPSFLFVPGEERDSVGAKTAALTSRTAGYIIVGEPTENQLALGHKGALSYTIETQGITAHSAYPELGSSAVHTLLDILADLRAHQWGEDAVLGPSTLNIGHIAGGIAPNVLADSARATVLHRIVDSLARRKQEVLDIVGFRGTLTFHSENDAQRMHAPEGFPTTSVAFGTDIPYLRPMGTPLLVGPGSIHDAHTDHEHVEIAALHEAVDLYIRLHDALTHEGN
jgi:acetylornithine deacetylase